MSAQLDTLLPRFRGMIATDLEAVLPVENAVYTHPWTRGNFADSLEAGYSCWIMECGATMTGYAVMMVAVGEAHVLNLSVTPAWQRRGLGSALLQFLIGVAQDHGALTAYLEVRVSNAAGRALYACHGFHEIGRRRDYYPAIAGREDAVVMERRLA